MFTNVTNPRAHPLNQQKPPSKPPPPPVKKPFRRMLFPSFGSIDRARAENKKTRTRQQENYNVQQKKSASKNQSKREYRRCDILLSKNQLLVRKRV